MQLQICSTFDLYKLLSSYSFLRFELTDRESSRRHLEYAAVDPLNFRYGVGHHVLIPGGTNYSDFRSCVLCTDPFDSKMADEQRKLSNCRGNRGFLVGTRHIILTKCSLSCGQHFADHVHVKISWHLFVFIKL